MSMIVLPGETIGGAIDITVARNQQSLEKLLRDHGLEEVGIFELVEGVKRLIDVLGRK